MATFNINGCGALLRAFTRNKGTHKVLRYLTDSNQLSWFYFNDNPKENLIEEDLKGTVNKAPNIKNARKFFLGDYNHIYPEFEKSVSDYFILDFTDLIKYDILEEKPDLLTSHHFTYSKYIRKINSKKKQVLDLIPGKKLVLDRLKLLTPEVIDKIVKEYAFYLRELNYNDRQIILVKTYNCTKALCDNSFVELYEYDKAEEENNTLNRIYNSFLKEVKNCNVIELPENSYVIKSLSNDRESLNYSDEICDYIYDCINIIAGCDKYNKTGTDFMLNLLDETREYYKETLAEKISKIQEDSNNLKELVDEHKAKTGVYDERGIICFNTYYGKEKGWSGLSFENNDLYVGEVHDKLSGFYAYFYPEIKDAHIKYAVRRSDNTWTPTHCDGQKIILNENDFINGIRIFIDYSELKNCDFIYTIYNCRGDSKTVKNRGEVYFEDTPVRTIEIELHARN